LIGSGIEKNPFYRILAHEKCDNASCSTEVSQLTRALLSECTCLSLE